MMGELYNKYLVIKRTRLDPMHHDGMHPRILESAKAFLAALDMDSGGEQYFVVKSTDPKYQAVVDYVLNDEPLPQPPAPAEPSDDFIAGQQDIITKVCCYFGQMAERHDVEDWEDSFFQDIERIKQFVYWGEDGFEPVSDPHLPAPAEPTEAMIKAASSAVTEEEWFHGEFEENAVAIYKAMQSAAPSITPEDKSDELMTHSPEP